MTCVFAANKMKKDTTTWVFSQKLTQSVEMISGIYQTILDRAKISGQVSRDLDIDQMAEFIVTSLHGALIKMKINCRVEPLKLHKKFILKLVTNPV